MFAVSFKGWILTVHDNLSDANEKLLSLQKMFTNLEVIEIDMMQYGHIHVGRGLLNNEDTG